MSLVSHQTDNLDVVVASILDATESVMDLDLLTNDIEGGIISKVIWLGETLEEVKNGAAGSGTGGGVVVVPEEDPVVQIEKGDENAIVDDKKSEVPRVLYAAIPMAFLLAFALLLARNKRKRDVRIPADLLSLDQDHVVVGTGDPPRCFHEGMYHYTRSGARYLSTNCADCAETRRIGFFTDTDDLATITEGRLYDPASPSFSFEDVSEDEELARKESNSSHHRKRSLVTPSSRNLGKKHSSVDVHQCTSATCRICAHRAGDVAFVLSPKAASRTSPKAASRPSPKAASRTSPKAASRTSPKAASRTSPKAASRTFASDGSGLGGSCVV
jgi:hypothetical protein